MGDEVYLPEAEFCRQFITHKGKCWGLCCQYLNGTSQEEMYHHRTGEFKKEYAEVWANLKRIQRLGEDEVFLDHKNNKCFRDNCKIGNHPMPRTDPDAQNWVDFEFVGEMSLKVRWRILLSILIWINYPLKC
ncbi:uncharacterized protein LOC141849765 [Brevipalpus obovatus]|uniref:uncharacterized protein LOC141849765 n=1 Tax=Brevipalpus obovatus TaxID=246614 RepID=UPI003D9DB709